MTVEFRLPDVGEGLEEAEVVRWLVKVGEAVERDQAIVEIQTDKALVEIPSPEAGRVGELAAEEGDIVKVGDLLFVIDDGASPKRAKDKPERKPRKGKRVKAAPAVRRLAVELGVELAEVMPSGAAGRVTADDVRSAAAAVSTAAVSTAAMSAEGAAIGIDPEPTFLSAARAEREGLGQAPFGKMPLRGIRRVTAKTMARAWSTIPHIHSSDEIDATALLETRRKLQARLGDEARLLTPVPFFILAVARALRRYPLVNASLDLDGEEILVHERVHVGVAVATPEGLIVPVVRDADRRSLVDLAREIDRLGQAARSRKVTPEELRGGTFTVSNYGSLGGRFATPIIRPPEVAIMGFGAIRQRPFVVEDVVAPRSVLPICFGADHRLIDGDLSVAFQELVQTLLSDPVQLLLGE